jgi:hypothetical protein
MQIPARAWAIRPAEVAAALLGCIIALAGCGSGNRSKSSTDCPECAATIAQTRADTYAAVAMRIYHQEVAGAANASAFATIAALPDLAGGLTTGDYALVRRTLNGQPVRHAVRARLVRGGKVLADVGLRFVIGGQPRPLIAPDGTNLGQMEVSVQDVIGFIKLVSRLTGTAVVVRGTVGHHAKSSLPAALHATLPATGPVTVGGRRYTVSSFARPGFGGEQLRAWILAPA